MGAWGRPLRCPQLLGLPPLWAGRIMHGKIQQNTPATGNRLRIKFLESNYNRTNSHPEQGREGFNRVFSLWLRSCFVSIFLSSEEYHSLHLIARLLLSLSLLAVKPSPYEEPHYTVQHSITRMSNLAYPNQCKNNLMVRLFSISTASLQVDS